jgi:hypothetical protein
VDRAVWCEFPFADDAEGDANVVDRLAALLDVASRLEAVGWPLKLTTTGVAFGKPEGGADELLRLGIEEPFSTTPGRTPAEVLGAVGQLHDSLREGALNAEEFGRLSAFSWVLGLDPPTAEPVGLPIQLEAGSG